MAKNIFMPTLAHIRNFVASFSKIPKEDFLKKAKEAGLAENDLEDVDLVKLYEKGQDAKLATEDDINEIKANIGLLPIFAWRGNGIPPLPPGRRLYFVHSIVLPADPSKRILVLPSGVPDGVMFSFENNSRTYKATILASGGETINGVSSFSSDKDTLAFFVKSGKNWVYAFGGVFPNNYDSLKSTMQVILDDELHTYDEIVTELKRRGLISSGTGGGTLVFDDEVNNVGGVEEVDVEGMSVTPDPTDNKKIKLKTMVEFSTLGTQFDGKGYKVKVLPPLNVYSDPNVKDGIRIEIQPGTFAEAPAPSYLAYLSEDEETSNREKTKIHEGHLWFGDVASPSGPDIQINKAEKTIGIQDYTGGDPNVTGGVNYFVSSQIALKGEAPANGYVEYSWKEKISGNIATDFNGQPLVVRERRSQGQEFGTLGFDAVVNAKGLKEYYFDVKHNFDDGIVILDKTEGASGVCIQALGAKGKTSPALTQWFLDTGRKALISEHYNGPDLVTLKYYLNSDVPMTDISTGQGETSVEGFHLDNLTPMRVGVQNSILKLNSQGGNMCYFTFGYIFTAEKTLMLKNKQIKITAKLQDKDNGFRIAIAKWNGAPNKYTGKIFTGVSNSQPQLATNWSLAPGDIFVSEDVVSGEHIVTGTLTVPNDTNMKNFAVIIYPVGEQNPCNLNLAGFKVDTVNPFYYYVVKSSKPSENRLEFDTTRALFSTEIPEGNIVFRYTINDTPTKLPAGIKLKGLADVSNDRSWNTAGNSWECEGNLKAEEEGRIFITDAKILLHPGEGIPKDGSTTFEMYLENVSTKQEVPGSKFTVPGDLQKDAEPEVYSLNNFSFWAEKGDTFEWYAKAGVKDGAFIQSSNKTKPLFSYTVQFKELVSKG